LDVKLETCCAAITKLLAWLAWLRAMEAFLVQWIDITITLPADGPHEGLLIGMGVVLVSLLAQTKSDQSRAADMVIAYETALGNNLGWWLDALAMDYSSISRSRADRLRYLS
jgi:hypothetical protein